MTSPDRAETPAKVRSPRLVHLIVDPDKHGREIARFLDKVVTPPPAANGTPSPMCALWRGAVADDGYGRFAIVRGGVAYTAKPHRYAVAWKLGLAVAYGQVIEHIDCDNPLCCYAHPDPARGHIWPSTQADNLRRMAHKGRGGGSGWWRRKWSGLSRTERAERSRQLRDAVRDGWDEARVREVLLRIDPAQTVLF